MSPTLLTRRHSRSSRYASLIALAAALLTAVVLAPTASAASGESIASCTNTTPPSWFFGQLTTYTTTKAGVPSSWASGAYGYDMARIACYESTYRLTAYNGSCCWGMYQFSMTSLAGTGVTWTCYWYGCSGLRAAVWQDIAALRYAKSRYGDPAKAWAHQVSYGWW